MSNKMAVINEQECKNLLQQLKLKYQDKQAERAIWGGSLSNHPPLDASAYKQVCVWHYRILDNGGERNFERYFKETAGLRVKYLETILTKHDKDVNGKIILEKGGQYDIFFAVHSGDLKQCALKKVDMDFRYFEDVMLNGGRYMYPEDIMNYWSWNPKDKKRVLSFPPNKSVHKNSQVCDHIFACKNTRVSKDI